MKGMITEKSVEELVQYEKDLWKAYYSTPIEPVKSLNEVQRVHTIILLIGKTRARRKELLSNGVHTTAN